MRALLATLALLLPLRALAADLEVKAVPFLEPTVGADLGPVETPLITPAAIALPPAIAASAFQISPMAAAPLSMTQAPAALPARQAVNPAGIVQSLSAQNDVVSKVLAQDQDGIGAKDAVDRIYFGGRRDRGGVSAGSFGAKEAPASGERVTPEGLTIGPAGERGNVDPASSQATFILNDERIPITGRAADYYQETKRLEKVLQRKGVRLDETMDVMDDAFAETLTKIKIIEKVGAADSLAQNVHLPETLTWVDAVTTKDGLKTAVHTQRVYFHTASGEAKSESEVAEGIRRIDKSIQQSIEFFAAGGKADKEIMKLDEEGKPLDRVVLGFDTRGYRAIKEHIQAQEAKVREQYGDRFSFVFLDDQDTKLSKEQVRRELTPLVKKYKGHGLQRIIEGVTYSRYTGLLLELKGLEYRLAQGATILQSGRDMFNDGVDDPSRRGMYETELDVVSRARDGRIDMDEEKSARVVLSQDDVLNDKFLYKLEAYKRNRALIARVLGGVPRINFVVDVGGLKREAAYAGAVEWKNPRQLELVRFLQSKERELSEKYGFDVKFVFLSSYPGVDPLLMEKWLAAHPDPAGDKALLKEQRRADRKAEKARRRRGS